MKLVAETVPMGVLETASMEETPALFAVTVLAAKVVLKIVIYSHLAASPVPRRERDSVG